MKLTPIEQWSAEVREDFESCLGVDTKQWLIDNYIPLFNGPIASRVRPKVIDAEGAWLTVKIDVRTVDKLIYERLGLLIEMQREEISHEQGKGRSKHDPRQAKYRFASRPDVVAWEIGLHALRLSRTVPKSPLWQIGLALASEYPIAQGLRKQADGPDRRKELASLASRYIKSAKATCAAVASGVYK